MPASVLTVFQLLRLSGLSVYWNPYLREESLVGSLGEGQAWRDMLRQSIDSRMLSTNQSRQNNERFQFSASIASLASDRLR